MHPISNAHLVAQLDAAVTHLPDDLQITNGLVQALEQVRFEHPSGSDTPTLIDINVQLVQAVGLLEARLVALESQLAE